MSWLPRSPKARRRLWIVAAVAPVLALAAGLSLYAMSDSVTYFYSPSEVTVENAPEGRAIRLGGLVEMGSVEQRPDGQVAFAVTDNAAVTRVIFRGDLPDLFREGQGIVAEGSFEPDRTFRARQVLAKHDETYMPREIADRLKAKGEWRPESAPPAAPAAVDGQQTSLTDGVLLPSGEKVAREAIRLRGLPDADSIVGQPV